MQHPHRLSMILAWLLVLSWSCISGCATDPTLGYATTSTFPTQYSTVAVHIFENDTFYRSVEFDLTEALIKEIESRTPYKVTQTGRADTILSGRITEVDWDQLSKSRQTGLSEEMIVSVTLDFTWKDARSEQALTERSNFQGSSLFLPSPPHGEPEELARFSVVQQLARDIVDEMRAQW